MSEVLETSDRQVDSVFVIVDPFWTTFVFGTFSSGKFYRHRKLSTDGPEGWGMSMFVVLEGVVGMRTAYSYSLYFSDQV